MPTPMPNGQPAFSKMSDQRVEAYLLCLEQGMTREAAAGAIGVHRNTPYGWMNHDPEFAKLVVAAEDKAEASFTALLRAHAVMGDLQATTFWLERRRSAKWGKRDRVDVTVDIKALAKRIVADGEAGMDVDQLLSEAELLLESGE